MSIKADQVSPRLPSPQLPHWEPKVPQAKISLLYERDAQGIADSELIDEVGWALWGRCDSILTVTAAHNGQVHCPACSEMIARQNPWSPEEVVECGKCGWHITWSAYHQSYRGRQLFGANAVSAFEAFHQAFPKARVDKDKMVLIDQLVHAFHLILAEIGRPAAANLIEGSLKEVIHFLDRLTSGEASAAGIGGSRQAWRDTLAAAEWAKPFMEQVDVHNGSSE